MAAKSFKSVMRASRGKSTTGRQERGDQKLIGLDEEDKRKDQNFFNHASIQ
jgi:hypothetical protein